MKCQVCGEELAWTDYVEYDGFDGSDEGYWECPNNHSFPDIPDTELTPEELETRRNERIGLKRPDIKYIDKKDPKVYIL